MDEVKKCPKCKGEMLEGIGLTPRGGFLFWGKTVLDVTVVSVVGGITGLIEWLKGRKSVSGSRFLIKLYKCQKCGYLEGYA